MLHNVVLAPMFQRFSCKWYFQRQHSFLVAKKFYLQMYMAVRLAVALHSIRKQHPSPKASRNNTKIIFQVMEMEYLGKLVTDLRFTFCVYYWI